MKLFSVRFPVFQVEENLLSWLGNATVFHIKTDLCFSHLEFPSEKVWETFGTCLSRCQIISPPRFFLHHWMYSFHSFISTCLLHFRSLFYDGICHCSICDEAWSPFYMTASGHFRPHLVTLSQQLSSPQDLNPCWLCILWLYCLCRVRGSNPEPPPTESDRRPFCRPSTNAWKKKKWVVWFCI